MTSKLARPTAARRDEARALYDALGRTLAPVLADDPADHPQAVRQAIALRSAAWASHARPPDATSAPTGPHASSAPRAFDIVGGPSSALSFTAAFTRPASTT